MHFTGHENHSITLAEAAEMTKNFRDQKATQPLGGFFGKDAIEAILNQEECVGLRYYNAENAKGELTIVLVGVKANMDDMFNGVLAEFSRPTPTYSGVKNPLNS